MNTLGNFAHRSHFKAGSGERGARQRQQGKAGEELILTVPPGTLVYADDGEALIVRQKDLLFALEGAIDLCEDAMDAIRSVVVKNG